MDRLIIKIKHSGVNCKGKYTHTIHRSEDTGNKKRVLRDNANGIIYISTTMQFTLTNAVLRSMEVDKLTIFTVNQFYKSRFLKYGPLYNCY
jgi:hypothetical protein